MLVVVVVVDDDEVLDGLCKVPAFLSSVSRYRKQRRIIGQGFGADSEVRTHPIAYISLKANHLPSPLPTPPPPTFKRQQKEPSR